MQRTSSQILRGDADEKPGQAQKAGPARERTDDGTGGFTVFDRDGYEWDDEYCGTAEELIRRINELKKDPYGPADLEDLRIFPAEDEMDCYDFMEKYHDFVRQEEPDAERD
jgi:hypothetical protein